MRSAFQMVFQDVGGSLSPRRTAFDTVAEPLRCMGGRLGGREIAKRVDQLAAQVGLPAHLLRRLPHELSGGEKARVGIARAIALQPSLLAQDEPTAALDVQVQAMILALLADLRDRLAMSYLLVSHDLTVVRIVCSRIYVMRAGQVVESGPTDAIMSAPTHPNTQALVDAIPRPLTQSAPSGSDPMSLHPATRGTSDRQQAANVRR